MIRKQSCVEDKDLVSHHKVYGYCSINKQYITVQFEQHYYDASERVIISVIAGSEVELSLDY